MTDPYDTAPPADAMPPQSGITADIMGRPMVTSPEPEDITDGFHTMQELYDHRRALTAVLATIAAIDNESWRSKLHHPDDGPMFDGYFIVGIALPGGMISYHYPLKHWDEFAAVPVVGHAPKWDGHRSADVVDRLGDFASLLGQAVAISIAEAVAAQQADVPEAEAGSDG